MKRQSKAAKSVEPVLPPRVESLLAKVDTVPRTHRFQKRAAAWFDCEGMALIVRLEPPAYVFLNRGRPQGVSGARGGKYNVYALHVVHGLHELGMITNDEAQQFRAWWDLMVREEGVATMRSQLVSVAEKLGVKIDPKELAKLGGVSS